MRALLRTVATAAAMVVWSMPAVAWAAPGDPDASFDGEEAPPMPFGEHLAVDPHGHIVVAGERLSPGPILVRYDGRGVLDPTFGDGGAALPLSGAEAHHLAALAVQPDDKPLVATAIDVDGRNAIRLVRLTTDGEPDGQFGTAGAVVIAGDDYLVLTTLLVQPNGGIVLAGTACAVPQDCAFWLARLHPDGMRDLDFGDDGRVTTDFDSSFGVFITDAALYPDGRIVVAGRTNDPTPGATALLARYEPDGRLDDGFGSGGRVETDFAQTIFAEPALAVAPDGTVVVASSNPSGPLRVTRFRTDGTIDAAFGDGGSTLVTTDEPESSTADVVVAPDGRIVAGGATGTLGVQTDWLLTALLPDGTIDATFGAHGIVTRDDGDVEISITDVVLQTDGRIVVVGSGFGGIAVERYLGFPRACGDADGDTEFTVTDGVQVLRAASDLPSACLPDFCDTDASGAITVSDGVRTLRLAAGIATDLRCPP